MNNYQSIAWPSLWARARDLAQFNDDSPVRAGPCHLSHPSASAAWHLNIQPRGCYATLFWPGCGAYKTDKRRACRFSHHSRGWDIHCPCDARLSIEHLLPLLFLLHPPDQCFSYFCRRQPPVTEVLRMLSLPAAPLPSSPSLTVEGVARRAVGTSTRRRLALAAPAPPPTADTAGTTTAKAEACAAATQAMRRASAADG